MLTSSATILHFNLHIQIKYQARESKDTILSTKIKCHPRDEPQVKSQMLVI